VIATLLVAGCGGGDTAGTGADAPSPVLRAQAQSAVPTESVLFDWAATAYPQYFNGSHSDGVAGVAGYGTFSYRFWPATGNYVGVLGGDVYVYGPVSGNAILRVGTLADFSCQVFDCRPAFTIQAVYPPNGSIGISRASGFAATLSAAASPPTVNANSVALKGPEGNVIAANVVVSGTDVRLVPPAGALPGDTTYTVNFAPAIQDTTGRSLSGNLTWTFTTSPQAWDMFETNAADTPIGLDEIQPSIAFDAAGNIWVTWEVADLYNDTMYAARLNTATGVWSAPTTIDSVAGRHYGQHMLCAQSGDCYLMWSHTQYSPFETAPRVARFDASTSTWSAPIEPPMTGITGDLSTITPSLDNAGNLILLIATTTGITALPLNTATQVWGAPNTFTFSAPTFEAHAVIDSAGNISVAWIHGSPTTRTVYGGHYDATSRAWSAEQPIEDTYNGMLSLALDGTGAVTALYSRGGFASFVSAARLDPATGLWGAPVRLDNVNPDVDGAFASNVVGDAGGYVTALWGQNQGMWTSRYSPVSGTWSPPSHVSTTIYAGSVDTLVADAAGNVTASWSSDFGAGACRWLVKDAAWGPVTDISVPAVGSVIFTSRTMATATSPSGNVATTWYQRNDVNGVQQHKLVLNVLH